MVKYISSPHVLKEVVNGNAASTFRAVGVSLSSAAIAIFPMLILIFMCNLSFWDPPRDKSSFTIIQVRIPALMLCPVFG